uniref:sensor histidine kinase n=1 Tax=Herbidospora sakaeratensis TaxID=564415 RepID=UPI001FE24236|nr:histidine kinase [Herbidospora sakaeratensis]
METGERPPWWRLLLDSGRERARPSRWAVAADVVVALVLTFVVLAVAKDLTGSAEYLSLRPESDPLPPPLPVLPEVPDGSGPAPGSPPPLVLVALTALPLAVRRRFPLATCWVVLAAALATQAAATWITVLTCAVATYGAVVHGRNRVLAMGGLVLAAVLAGVAFRDVAPAPSWMGPFVVLLGVGVAASFVGRLAELRRAQEEATRRAVAEERSRIAAELHDVVTHNVSVMVIQAGAARKVVDVEPELSKEALLAIESGGRAAMAELRHVMGLLAGPGGDRLDGPADGLEPQPGLDRLDALVDGVRAAGVPVRTEVAPPGPLPPGVDLAAYRVVQEALTNTLKHAPGAAASVRIGGDAEWLEIEVTDTGGTRGGGPRAPGGRGLMGLRERLAVYGGTLEAGRTVDGGFRLAARVPWGTP